jgi:glutathione synthase/RimK-type ligase-like ATP-grasp enzyme
MKIFLTDSESRKGFDVVSIYRGLHKRDVILSASKDYGWKLGIIYGKKVFPCRISDYHIFREDLSNILKNFKEEALVFVPVSEKATLNFFRYIAETGIGSFKFLLPDPVLFSVVSDKYQFQMYCEKEGFPVPGSFSAKDIPTLKTHFIPVLAKPRKGEGSVGIVHINAVEDLSRLDKINLDDYVIQEKISNGNRIEGAFFLCKDGEVVASYSHRRIRTFPEVGGVTVCSASENNEQIITIGARLLSKLKWQGFAMIEFLYCEKSKQWKIIELNPRLWGSVLLSAFNNSNMLENYVRLCENRVLLPSQLKNPSFIRWLFPFEFINLLKGKISLGTFFNLKRLPICYINFTYASFWQSFSFMLFFIFNSSSLKRFIKKISR